MNRYEELIRGTPFEQIKTDDQPNMYCNACGKSVFGHSEYGIQAGTCSGCNAGWCNYLCRDCKRDGKEINFEHSCS